MYVVKKTINKKNVRAGEIDRHINKKKSNKEEKTKIDFDLLEGSFVRGVLC